MRWGGGGRGEEEGEEKRKRGGGEEGANFRFCCRLFLFVVCACILCLLPCHTRCSFIDVLSCTPTGVSETNQLT